MNDVVVVMMESWSPGARVGPQVGGLGGCAPTVRESARPRSAAGKVAHTSHHRHHRRQHRRRISRRLGEFTVPENPVPPNFRSGNHLWSEFTFGSAAGEGGEAPESGGVWPEEAGCVCGQGPAGLSFLPL